MLHQWAIDDPCWFKVFDEWREGVIKSVNNYRAGVSCAGINWTIGLSDLRDHLPTE